MRHLRSLFAALLVALIALPVAAQKVNFGPDADLDTGTYPEFIGYLGDDGSAFGDRGNGFTYGWLNGALEPDPQAETRNRNNDDSPDERYDTVNHMIKGDNNSWQIDLPNGDYNIMLVAGDPNHTDQVNDITVSGGTSPLDLMDPDGQDNFDEFGFAYSVTEGYLRLSPTNDDMSQNQKLAFIEIVPEPGTFTLLSFGLLGLLAAVRRRKR